MRIFKKISHTLCTGEKEADCNHFVQKKHFDAHKINCEECGSPLREVEVTNTVAIAVTGIVLALTIGGLSSIAWRLVSAGLFTPTPPKIEVSLTPSPSVEVTPSVNPSPSPTASASPSPRGFPFGSPSPDVSPSLSPTDPIPPISKPPPLPNIEQIQRAISKLDAMNPNEILEFPVEGDEKYRVIGYQSEDGRYFGWNAKNVKEFLEESLKMSGKFPDGQDIKLIVRNQDDQKKLDLKPISRNSPLGHFVRSLNSM